MNVVLTTSILAENVDMTRCIIRYNNHNEQKTVNRLVLKEDYTDERLSATDNPSPIDLDYPGLLQNGNLRFGL